jgi:hypothetical protein
LWPLKLPLLEDHSAIRLALGQILNAISAGAIDARQAGHYLRGLQLAARILDRETSSHALDAVHSLTLTEDGDELAPEVRRCNRPEDCVACTLKETCKGWEPESKLR